MKKLIIFLFYVSLFSFIGINLIEASELTASKINARILPSVWYSTLSINDGESIKIYSAIQNNSDVDFNGNATFYVDEENISNVSFVSNKDTLKDISTNWVAVPGVHTIKVKISASLPPNQELVSYESDTSTITIIEKVVEKEKIININNETLENIKDTISDVISKVDEVAIPLSEKIKSFKKIDIATDDDKLVLDSNSSNNADSEILGASAEPEDTKKGNTAQSAFNIVLDFLSILVKNWLWTLGGISALFLFMKIR